MFWCGIYVVVRGSYGRDAEGQLTRQIRTVFRGKPNGLGSVIRTSKHVRASCPGPCDLERGGDTVAMKTRTGRGWERLDSCRVATGQLLKLQAPGRRHPGTTARTRHPFDPVLPRALQCRCCVPAATGLCTGSGLTVPTGPSAGVQTRGGGGCGQRKRTGEMDQRLTTARERESFQGLHWLSWGPGPEGLTEAPASRGQHSLSCAVGPAGRGRLVRGHLGCYSLSSALGVARALRGRRRSSPSLTQHRADWSGWTDSRRAGGSRDG